MSENNVTDIRTRRPEPAMSATERQYGRYTPKGTYGEVRVGTWDNRAKDYVGFHYFDGEDAEERALDYADDLMRHRGQKPEPEYPEGHYDVEVLFFDGYTGYHGTAQREHNKEETRRVA